MSENVLSSNIFGICLCGKILVCDEVSWNFLAKRLNLNTLFFAAGL